MRKESEFRPTFESGGFWEYYKDLNINSKICSIMFLILIETKAKCLTIANGKWALEPSLDLLREFQPKRAS